MKNKEAIEILKTESCADCSCHPESPMSCINTKCPLVEATLLAIKALEAQRWIPVTERLPEINVDVIVTDIETIETYSSYYLGDGFWECDNGTHNNRIIAWMPFPEPYTKEEQS